MTAFQVLLVILGLALIAISYFISEKLTGAEKQKRQEESASFLTEEKINEMKEQIVDTIREDLDVDIARTEDKLSEISNEKIIAVSEYSDQILEKINQNHTEVVFLYNMLNEKEETIKNLLNRKAPQKEEQPQSAVRQRTRPTAPVNQMKLEASKDNSRAGLPTTTLMEEEGKEIPTDEILALHKKGKSVIEIAKQLEIGQGEIQLVIGLAKGVKS